MEDAEKFEKFLKKTMEKMPLELQKAAAWLLSNMDIIDELLKTSYMTEESRENCLNQAKSKHEYILLALLAYQKICQEGSSFASD